MKLNLDWPARPASELVSSYDVQMTLNGSALPIANVPTNHFEIDNPAPGNYTAKVRAKNVAGDGLWSNVTTGPGLPGTPPAPTITVTE